MRQLPSRRLKSKTVPVSAPLDVEAGSSRSKKLLVAGAVVGAVVAALVVGASIPRGQADRSVSVASIEGDWTRAARAMDPAVVYIDAHNGGVGSGFFISDEYVVTAAHVILAQDLSQYYDLEEPEQDDQDAEKEESSKKADNGSKTQAKDLVSKKVTVTTSMGVEVPAKIVGLDARSDVALLKVSPVEGTRAVTWSNLQGIDAGTPAATLGHPLGLGTMLTVGVVSGMATNSPFAIDSAQNWLIQADVPVNPGNSGGPLFAMDGSVLGVVVLRPDELGGRPVEDMALAVPSVQAKAVVERLKKGEGTTYPRMGAIVKEDLQGVLLDEVQADSPAEEAGLEAGDILTSLDGQELARTDDLFRLMSTYQAGQEVQLDVLKKDGSKEKVKLVFEER